MRILLLTQWFDPEPTFKGLAFARALKQQGHEVEVITGFPNYPGGKVYTGYHIRFFQRELIDGIRLVRVPLYPSHDQSALGRILNYTSFMLSSLCLGGFLTQKPDVIYAYHPPLTTGISAALLGFLKNAPVVYDIQDLWPDTLAATGMMQNKRLLDVLALACQWVYHQAAHITVLSKGFKQRLIERHIPAQKISVIPNWADETQLKLEHYEQLAQELNTKNRFTIVFAGTMGKAQALGTVLEAAQQLSILEPRVQFVFVGGGVELEWLQNETARLSLSNVRFLPRRPMSEVGQVLACADVLLVHLKDDPLFAITIPSKTQAYLAVGKPLLMAVRGDAADLVTQAKAGVCCEPENAQDLTRAVQYLMHLPADQLQSLGQQGQAFYQKYLSLEVGTEQFLQVFSQLPKTRLNWVKRIFDVVASSLALIILSPLLMYLAYLIQKRLGSPILFSQQRPGLHGKPFRMYKFRTMTNARDKQGELLPDAERLTDFGKWLRATSLDELPELWNVLRGDMSLVGPRPLLMEYLERYTPEQARRHDVKPGITGWAQVNGRNAISWEEKFKLDSWYVNDQSFWLDLKILLLTVQKVLKRDGISAANDATMPIFTGSKEQ